MKDTHILHQIPYQTGRVQQLEALGRMVPRVREQLRGLDVVKRAKRPLFIGMGASFAAAALPVDLLRRHGMYAERMLASDIAPGMALPDTDLVVAISQSGRSTETIQAVSLIDHSTTACLVNIADSELGRACDTVVTLGDEPDSYASTVAYVGTVAALELIAGAMLGVDWSSQWQGARERLETFRDQANPQIVSMVGRCQGIACVDLVADGAQSASAEEGALLLREVCRVPSASSTTRNYLHGEMESAGDTLHVVIGSGREVELARMLAGSGHHCVLLTEAVVPESTCLTVIQMPDGVRPGEQVVATTMVMQCLASALAANRGVEIEDFVFSNGDTKTELAPQAA